MERVLVNLSEYRMMMLLDLWCAWAFFQGVAAKEAFESGV